VPAPALGNDSRLDGLRGLLVEINQHLVALGMNACAKSPGESEAGQIYSQPKQTRETPAING
jgi:hypothetical protein